tara:strand:- start:198 stop:635 length:438 start_codon:yes stop_codon:yes gene_type:complete
MARRKKYYSYKFIDCEKKFNSSVLVTCTQTKEKIKMYHKQLVKLIKNKYNNNYGLFVASYIKKGNKPIEDRYDENGDFNPAPEGYKKYLITAYLAVKNSNMITESNRRAQLSFFSDCYLKRYNGSLDQVVKLVEQVYSEVNENTI